MLNLRSFAADREEGQNLIEYALLMAFFALMASSIFIAAGLNTRNVWEVSNTQLAAANATASGDGSAPAAALAAPPSTPGSGGGAGDSPGQSGASSGRHDDHVGSH